MNKALATALSYIIHPALIPMLGVALVLVLSPHFISQSIFYVVMLQVFLGTYLFPLLLALALKRFGLLSSLSMAEPAERRIPYIMAALFYFITAHNLRDYPIPPATTSYLLSGVIILAVALVFLSFIKISIHTAGLGAFTALTIFLSFYYSVDLLFIITLAIVLAGLIATARLYLAAHTPIEVYVGFLVGVGSVVSVFGALI
jgi:membrane-associated phospholipid phosphatase